jgi:hypothetical protein
MTLRGEFNRGQLCLDNLEEVDPITSLHPDSLKTPSTSDHAEIPYKPYEGRWWMLALFSLANFM